MRSGDRVTHEGKLAIVTEDRGRFVAIQYVRANGALSGGLSVSIDELRSLGFAKVTTEMLTK